MILNPAYATASDPTARPLDRGRALREIIPNLNLPTSQLDSYCKSCFSLGYERARQLMEFARVFDTLREAGAVLLPESESQLRPLIAVPLERLVETWSYIATMSPDPVPSAEMIAAICDQVKANRGVLHWCSLDDLPDMLWPSDNEYQIPLLSLEGQADTIPAPVATWGSLARSSASGVGTYHFYTNDERFSGLVGDPTPLVNSGVLVAVEPNFSVYGQTPRALALGRIYHKRYIARFWQSQGVKIIVDLNVNPAYYQDNLLGVPKGWKAYATRGYSDQLEALDAEHQIARQHSGIDDPLFLVIGGGSPVKQLAQDRGWLWIAEHQDRVRGRMVASSG